MQRARLRELRLLRRRTPGAWQAEPHAQPRPALRAAAAVLPAEQQLLDGDARRRLGRRRGGRQPASARRADRPDAAVHPVRRGARARTTPTGTTSRRASAWPGRRGGNGGFLKTLLGSERRQRASRPATRWRYNRPGMSDFTGAFGANPGVSLIGQPQRRARQPRHAGTISSCSATPRGPRPAGDHAADARLPDDATSSPATSHIFEPDLQVPYAQTWTGGWQRKLAQQHGRRGPLRRHALAAGVADLQLQRDQHRRERVPERVPAWRRRTCRRTSPPGAATRSPTPGRRAPSPLPIFLAYFNAAAGGQRGRHGELHRHELDEHHVPRIPGEVQPEAVQLREHRRPTGLIGNATFRNNALTAGLPANFFQRQSGPDRRREHRRATAARPTTTRCSSSCASGCRTGCSSRRNYVLARQDGTQRLLAARAARDASRTRASKATSRTRSSATGCTSCRSARAGGSASGAGAVDEPASSAAGSSTASPASRAARRSTSATSAWSA